MENIVAKYIHVKGLVQGVGFRPYVFRLAVNLGLNGWVINGNDGVRVHVEGVPSAVDEFINSVKELAPPASVIDEIKVETTAACNFQDFSIRKSQETSTEITQISPDIAVCQACLIDLKHQAHRRNYPFINCTNCGPRFTIIQDLPYDREKTTMSVFAMCPVCKGEYSDILDRRFHAQPIACNHCGPEYKFVSQNEEFSGIDEILRKVSFMLEQGEVVAIKGMGGFHLACDATNETAVRKLRMRKYREGKPFAVMFGNIDTARQYLEIDAAEEISLTSWRRPIVILRNKKDGQSLADSVSNGFHTTGVMLPYMPFHYLMFEILKTPAIVLTSGNVSDEPIIIDNREAQDKLSGITHAFLTYNRDIFNRTDDSVVMVSGGKERLIRRSRGYVPTPYRLLQNVDGIFAAGAELVNCFCVGRGNQAIMSQHIGDLKNIETLDFFTESFYRFIKMFRVNPTHFACDLHPDYLSTVFTEEYARKNGRRPVLKVQHHHAHIASCMAENGIDEPVIGISLDGVGLGDDGHIWGFEIMKADFSGFERLSHLQYLEQPGGDLTSHEPWRMALSYICKYLGPDADISFFKFFNDVKPDTIGLVKRAISLGINAPLTSSAGRIFDAVAAMTGICTHSYFHAEAPMRLENILDSNSEGSYDIQVGEIIDPGEMIRSIYNDIRNKISPSIISAKFHRAMVNAIVASAEFAKRKTGISKVALSGGVFQNRFILSNSITALKNSGFDVYTQELYPSNDGGIALGQIAIAARRRQTGDY